MSTAIEFNTSYRVKHYLNSHDNSKMTIYENSQDSSVRAIFVEKDGTEVYGAEFHSNGQLAGKVLMNENGEIDGLVRYYHESGRVKSEGYFRNGIRYGAWKHYNSKGSLESISFYTPIDDYILEEEFNLSGQRINRRELKSIHASDHLNE